MRHLFVIALSLSLINCMSIYRHYKEENINSLFRTDGYYISEKNFKIFDKSTSSYSYIKFLSPQNKRLLFSHSAFPIAPSGKVRQGSIFKTTYKIAYDTKSETAIISFDNTISSFANYTGRIKMEINVKANENGYLEGFVFKQNKTKKKKK